MRTYVTGAKMFSKIASKWKIYVVPVLIAIVGVLYGLLSASKAKLSRERQQDAESQRDTLVRAQENINEAHQQGVKDEKDAIDRSKRGDWSGFN